ncbi:M20/M25/M40 family metallo-hydrolase [Aeromicrobium stalagmiti]|uniref:M20/M25/M40 family metallo-hydrolase n=1 Tax=Aeromicrobium stalagmiti TaxID=2738988 RepID=UPI0015695672|nr:M20/M25/M40 family metallo-hydrolase [Aeromicrobium stalagmiti]NRQ50696.1 M20/M25/M40 family metallo-hydrolase [Aeromicrobium stalagmiti]
MRKTLYSAAAVVLTSSLAIAVPADAKSNHHPKGVDTSRLTKAVTVNGQLTTLRQLQVIADRNDGNRASGLPGYDQSASYVAAQLKKAGYKVTKQTFTFPFSRDLEPATLAQVTPEAKDIETEAFDYSGSGDVTGAVTPINVSIPPGDPGSTPSGCEASDFPAAGSEPSVALVQRGLCNFGVKAANAEAAGYDAVIIFNEGQEGRQELLTGTLGDPVDIPVVGISYDDGVALNEAAGATVRVTTKTEVDLNRETTNVIADLPRKTKNPDQVVVVGAHLDSVAAGPGINDNGTGTAGVLEIAKQYVKTGYAKKAQRPVRFAFWGAEEKGLLGAYHYVESLTDAQRAKIYANLNFDMIGSPNFARFVYDGDGSSDGNAGPAGSAEIEKVFLDYFGKKKLSSAPTSFDGRSDYGPFIEVGIPAGGLFSGAEGIKTPEEATLFGGTAGAAYDSCYHQACDDITNLSTRSIDQLGDAAAHSVAVLALSKKGLYGDQKRSTSASAAKKLAQKASHGHALTR